MYYRNLIYFLERERERERLMFSNNVWNLKTDLSGVHGVNDVETTLFVIFKMHCKKTNFFTFYRFVMCFLNMVKKTYDYRKKQQFYFYRIFLFLFDLLIRFFKDFSVTIYCCYFFNIIFCNNLLFKKECKFTWKTGKTFYREKLLNFR